MPKTDAVLTACALCLLATAASAAEPVDVAVRAKDLFRRDNLVAWCIVPFDARKRGPEERAAMMEKMGFKHFAYDWRPEHVPTFEQEFDCLKAHGIALDAFWAPGPHADSLLASFTNRGLKPSFWVMIAYVRRRDLSHTGRNGAALNALRVSYALETLWTAICVAVASVST